MEQRNNLVLQGTETFSRGQLDNVALESGSIVLDSAAGRYLQYGSYTTPEFAMPAFCNLNVSWNAHAPHNTMVEVRCRVYAGNAWTGWMSFGKWAPDYPRCSVNAQSEDGMVFLMGDTVTVATPGGGTGVQLQVNLSSNDDKVTPALRLLAAAVRPVTWEKQEGHPINRRLYLPEYCLSAHDPSFGREMDLPLVMAALMNRFGEDILPEEVAYVMEDKATGSTGNGAFAAAAAGCCGYPCWQAWMDLKDLRAQIHDGCSVAVRVERRVRGQRDSVGVWMGLRGFGHDDAVLADFVLLNDPTADTDGAVNCTMAVTDFLRYFTGRAIALRGKPRDVEADRPPPHPVRAGKDGRARRVHVRAAGPERPAARGIFRLAGGQPPRWDRSCHHRPPDVQTAGKKPLRAASASARSSWPRAGGTACTRWTRPAGCGWPKSGSRCRPCRMNPFFKAPRKPPEQLPRRSRALLRKNPIFL